MSELLEHKDELVFVRTYVPRIIPQELIEQVKGRTFTAGDFYAYQERQYNWGEDHKNRNNLLYVLVDREKKVKGYLWAYINDLDNTLFINTISIAKEYWHKGRMIPLVVEKIKEIIRQYGASRTFWITSNPKFYEKFGFKQSRNVLMEHEGLKTSRELEQKFRL